RGPRERRAASGQHLQPPRARGVRGARARAAAPRRAGARARACVDGRGAHRPLLPPRADAGLRRAPARSGGRMSPDRGMRSGVAVILATVLAVAGTRVLPAGAQAPTFAQQMNTIGAPVRTTRPPYRVRVVLSPSVAQLGETITYRAGLTEGEYGKV